MGYMDGDKERYLPVFVCVYNSLCACVRVCVCICMYKFMCMCDRVCTQARACILILYQCLLMFMCVSVCVCVYCLLLLQSLTLRPSWGTTLKDLVEQIDRDFILFYFNRIILLVSLLLNCYSP